LLKQPEKRLQPILQNLKDPKAWISLLEPVLPRQLRSEGFHDAVQQNADLTAEEVSVIIARARYRGPKKLDILLSLADQGRWRAVVWLVTFMVDKLWKGNPQDRIYAASGPWSGVGNLEEHLETPAILPISSSTSTTNKTDLDQLLHDEHPLGEGSGRESTAGHEALGQIWQSLGNMIIKDATESTSIRLEILEILALLHNRGIMPKTIYNYTPAQDQTALRQPPTLHLLSSHIFTSLSDAAWRAHEKRVVEEAHLKGGPNSGVRPEVAGSVYRVRVGGLRHEVWLELILWACLQGGWLPYGAAVLEAAIAAPRPHDWTALSWRELIDPPVKAGQERTINWEEVGYMVDTGGYADSPDTLQQQAKVARTVTSEVVTAYLDGLISLVEVGVGRRGNAASIVVEYASKIKRFLLTRCNLGLEATSWDAIVQRIIESQTINIADSPGLASKILSLSSSYGEEIKTNNSPTRDEQWQPLSPYLIDGTAAILGIMHRIILAHVRRGDLQAALRFFEYLQSKVDHNKKIALVDFFTKLHQTQPQQGSKIDFVGSHPGLDYPTFFTQVPATTLAQFLDLITDAGMEDFGRWLLYSKDPDGATIHKGYYSNPVVAPALVRFATAFRDQDLLAAVLRAVKASAYERDRYLAAPLLLAIMDSQLQLHNYPQCAATLETFALHPLMTASHVHNLVALMIRARLTAEFLPRADQSRKEQRHDFRDMKKLFGRVATGRAGTFPTLRTAIHDMLVVAACINEEWAALCAPYLPRRLYARPSSKACTNVIRAVVTTMGAGAGRRMIETLWAPAREEEDLSYIADGTEDGVNPMSTEEAGIIAPQSRSQTAIRLTSSLRLASSTSSKSEQSFEKRAIICYRPNVGAIRAVLVQAHAELVENNENGEKHAERLRSDDSKIGWMNDSTVRWCVRMMRLLGREVKDIDEEINIKARRQFEIEEDDEAADAGSSMQ